REHPLDPRARGAWGWAWGLAGLLLGAAAWLFRGARPPANEKSERARQREWLRASRLSGPDFWRAAEEASAWLQARGAAVADLRRDIETARYSGGRADPAPIPPRQGASPARA